MPNFKNFIDGRNEDRSEGDILFSRYKQPRNVDVGGRVQRVWENEFKKCSSRDDYEKYINRYACYCSNKYVEKAKNKLQALEHSINGNSNKPDYNKFSQPQYSMHQKYESSKGSGLSDVVWTCMKIAGALLLVGLIGIYGISLFDKHDNPQIIQSNHEKDVKIVGNSYQDETFEEAVIEDSENIAETSQFIPCSSCGGNMFCPLCFKGFCGVCGGTGLGPMITVDGISDFPDCKNCGGSGACPYCEGTGVCQSCEGKGRIEMTW